MMQHKKIIDLGAYATALAAIGSALIYGLFSVIKPVVDSDAPPIASIARVEKVENNVVSTQAAQVRQLGVIQKALDAQSRSNAYLLKKSLTSDLQYWQAQEDQANLALRRNPADPTAHALRGIARQNIADTTKQIEGKF